MAGIYHNATLGLISLSSDGETWITISDKNLGATTVYNDGDTLSEANCGGFFQWGNNYMFPYSGTITRSNNQVNAQNYGPQNYYNSSTFIRRSSSPYYWDTSANNDLWGNTTNTNEARKGPCQNGYHIPTINEWSSIYSILVNDFGFASNSSTMKTYLKLPVAGVRKNTDGDVGSTGWGYYWSSTNGDASNANSIYFKSDYMNTGGMYRSFGFTIRPFTNEAVIPDYNDVWDTLYGDELPDRPPIPIKKLKWLKTGGNYYYFKDAPIHANSITLNESSITLTEAGQTVQLTATVSPDDAVEKHVRWSSSDLTVATVSQTGLVTCVTPGSCTITATCDGVSATCDVVNILSIIADFLLIGGGGAGGGTGGGNSRGGGGGAGGVIECFCTQVSSGEVTIGEYGCWQAYLQRCCGGDSCFGEYVAKGGGYGGCSTWGCSNYVGGTGGAGGGGAGSVSGGVFYNGGVGLQGGNGAKGDVFNGGGGGGACGDADGLNGGLGVLSSISGALQCYAGGGGGGGGGTGCYGGGNGTASSSQNGCPATTYGSGGGGGQADGANGYKGIFILRYPTSCCYNVTGGCKYTCGDYTIHCFTSDGTLTVS